MRRKLRLTRGAGGAVAAPVTHCEELLSFFSEVSLDSCSLVGEDPGFLQEGRGEVVIPILSSLRGNMKPHGRRLQRPWTPGAASVV